MNDNEELMDSNFAGPESDRMDLMGHKRQERGRSASRSRNVQSTRDVSVAQSDEGPGGIGDEIVLRKELEAERLRLERDYEATKGHLLKCFQKNDWHGVHDASVDILEIAGKLSAIKATLISTSGPRG